ncbi:MAG: threonine synthase [Clostridiales Family XIII bacterium]|jgi:threonine synthase|nr:threonine synthase [Clostridiales Family XIII bacterium]
MRYVSTRGDLEEKRSAQAIIKGLAPDKGLYVPTKMPKLQMEFEHMSGAAYNEIAFRIMREFLSDFEEEELRRCTDGAYDEKFDTPKIAPLVATKNAFFLELYHGRTAAFKDMALSILPYLLTYSVRKEKEDKKVVILTATSGDTGKAALEGFSDVSGTEIFVFYPVDGVSEIQKRQMVTQRGANTHVFAIKGNFDDAQAGVKAIFNDEAFATRLAAEDYKLSSANSINIGRLIPQIAYYFYAYIQLIDSGKIVSGDEINISVPTGNFGNILAAFYAKEMGLPVKTLICASNENRVLADFINSGVYDANRIFYLTSSPSMDILVSGNLERLLWHLSGENSWEIARCMTELETTGKYTVSDKIKDGMSCFYGGFANMDKAHAAIRALWEGEQYLIDTHTAVAYSVYSDYREKTGDGTPTVVASTASAYKFADRVIECLGLPKPENEFDAIDALREATGIPTPAGLRGLGDKKIIHGDIVAKSEMADIVEQRLSALRASVN